MRQRWNGTVVILLSAPLATVTACGHRDAPPVPTATPAASVVSKPVVVDESEPQTRLASNDVPCGPVNSRFALPDRPDLVGMTVSAVKEHERTEGHVVRLIGRDGVCADRTDDLNQNRVNVYIVDGKVAWAKEY